MPNPYNTRSAAQNANTQPENTQGYSQQMANQSFDNHEPMMSQQGQSVGQTMSGETMGHTMDTQDIHHNDSNQAMHEQDISQNNTNYNNQQSMGQTNTGYHQDTTHNQASGHEESLADKVENMLEKLASKITGHHDHNQHNEHPYK